MLWLSLGNSTTGSCRNILPLVSGMGFHSKTARVRLTPVSIRLFCRDDLV